MTTVFADRISGCSTWLSCGPVDPGTGVLFRFPSDLTWEQYELVADTADRLVAHLREDGEYGCPRDDLFWISHEELAAGPLGHMADALGLPLGYLHGQVQAFLVCERGDNWLRVTPVTR
jgi:hypothetical protein